MAVHGKAWYAEENTEVEVLNLGSHVSKIRYTVEPGIAVEQIVLNEDLLFEEEDE